MPQHRSVSKRDAARRMEATPRSIVPLGRVLLPTTDLKKENSDSSKKDGSETNSCCNQAFSLITAVSDVLVFLEDAASNR